MFCFLCCSFDKISRIIIIGNELIIKPLGVSEAWVIAPIQSSGVWGIYSSIKLTQEFRCLRNIHLNNIDHVDLHIFICEKCYFFRYGRGPWMHPWKNLYHIIFCHMTLISQLVRNIIILMKKKLEAFFGDFNHIQGFVLYKNSNS